MIPSFLTGISGQWTDVRVWVEGVSAGEIFRPWSSDPIDIPDESALILIARDEQMVAQWDDRGYALDHLGEGPLQIEYEPASWNSLQVQVLQDPLQVSGASFQRYEAVLVGPGYYVLSVVTPPAESEFSKNIIAKLRSFLGGS